MTAEERAQFITAVGRHPGTAGRAGGSSRQELWDAHGHGTPDHIDALATVIGGVLMLGWLTLVS